MSALGQKRTLRSIFVRLPLRVRCNDEKSLYGHRCRRAGAGVLSACATEKSDTGRREYDRSVADYENCIAANQMSTYEAEGMEANKKVLQHRRPTY